MGIPLRVLIVEDSTDDAELVLRQLRRAGYDPVSERVQTAAAMKTALEREAWDLVVSDYSMPQFDAPTALNLLNQSGRDIPFIVVSGSIGEDIAVEMMKTGVHDYILKQNLTRFVPAVQRELREAENRRQQRLTEQAKQRLQVERDGFLERLKQENEDLAALTQVTANAISTLDLEELLRVLLERVREVMRADTATILLADGAELRVRASAGAVNLSDSTHVKHVGECFADSVAARMKPVYVEDAAVDPLITDPLIRERGIRSMLGVPLKRNGTLIGVLHVDWLTVRPCRDREVHLLEITAERCAAAIQNAQLYQEARRIAATLAENEVRLRQLSSAVEQTADAVLITDRDGVIQYVNAAFEGMTGYSAAEVVGRKPSLLKSGQHTPEFFEHLWRTITAGTPFRAMFVNRHKNGALLYEEKTITPIKDQRGNITHFVSTAKDITERRQAEEERQRLTDVLEASLNEIYIFDAQTLHFEYVNACARHNLGYAMDAMRTMTPMDLKPEFPEAAFIELIGPLRRHEKAKIVFQTVHRRADGSLYPVEVHQQLVERGGKAVFLAVINDITERKQAEAVLREREARLRAIIDNEPECVKLVDKDGLILEMNPAGLRMIEADSFSQLQNQDLSSIIVKEHRAAFRALLGKNMRGESGVLEFGIIGLKGTRRTLDTHAVPLRDATGAVIGMLGITRDITERAAATAQIREQADLLNKARDAIMVAGLDNRITFWSQGAERITGWPAAEVLGKSVEEMFGVPVALTTARDATLATGAWHGEIKVRRKDGQLVVLDLRTTLIRDEAGQPKSRLSIGTDITEKKQLEEQALRAQRIESLGMLVAGIAHDFNNILAPLVMAVPLLEPRITDERGRGILALIGKSGARGSALVRQLLSFVSGASGGAQLLQARSVLRDVAEIAESTFPKSIQFESDLSGDLWPVTANAGQLHQVFLNLCINARDAMPQGGTLRLRAVNRKLTPEEAASMPDARPGAFLVVEVADTGTGIPPEILERIWEPFFTTKASGHGTGLGLSTVCALVHQHGGFIALQTRASHGTVFSVFLPAAETEPGTSMPPFAATALPRGNGECILVADDEQPVRDLVTLTLTKFGYRVLTAGDGAEALAIFAAHADEVKLLLTDCQMPLLGGPELAAAIHEIRPGLPIIAMSGAGSTAVLSQPHFACAFIPKPFTHESLLSAVYLALHRSSSSPPV